MVKGKQLAATRLAATGSLATGLFLLAFVPLTGLLVRAMAFSLRWRMVLDPPLMLSFPFPIAL